MTDLVLEETHKWLVHHAFPRDKAFKILEGFINESFAKILPIEDIDRATASLFLQKYLDQGLSYTDAITVSIMKKMKIKEVFAFDAHFDLFRGIQRVPVSFL
jgi:predicted nucleic acid-binding protein